MGDPHRTDAAVLHRGTVIIVNPNGLHMRPAMEFVRIAQQFAATVTVKRGSDAVNGKSLIELMMLAAEPGTELTVEVAGDDAGSALPELIAVLATPSYDD